MKILERIEKKVKEGSYLKRNIRFSPNICVSNNGLSYSCRIIIDEIYNTEEELIYTIEQHIENSNGPYYSLDIFDEKKKKYII